MLGNGPYLPMQLGGMPQMSPPRSRVEATLAGARPLAPASSVVAHGQTLHPRVSPSRARPQQLSSAGALLQPQITLPQAAFGSKLPQPSYSTSPTASVGSKPSIPPQFGTAASRPNSASSSCACACGASMPSTSHEPLRLSKGVSFENSLGDPKAYQAFAPAVGSSCPRSPVARPQVVVSLNRSASFTQPPGMPLVCNSCDTGFSAPSSGVSAATASMATGPQPGQLFFAPPKVLAQRQAGAQLQPSGASLGPTQPQALQAQPQPQAQRQPQAQPSAEAKVVQTPRPEPSPRDSRPEEQSQQGQQAEQQMTPKSGPGRPKPAALQTASLTKPPLELPAPLAADYEASSDLLGEGAFAVVRRLRQKRTGELVALKVVEKYPLHIRNMLPQLSREVRIQGRLQHRHILRLLSCMEDDSYVYMLLEHCAGGSLRGLCSKQPSFRLPEARAGRYFVQILQGVDFMHQNSCVHRDLKEENMLLTSDDEVRICDFGWSAEVQIEQTLKTTCGTPHYWPPEIFEGQSQDVSVDLWALGTLIYELLVGHSPFWGSVEELRKKVLAVDVRYPPKLLSDEAVQLFHCLLRRDPKSRVPASQLLSEHPWVLRAVAPGTSLAAASNNSSSTAGAAAPAPSSKPGIASRGSCPEAFRATQPSPCESEASVPSKAGAFAAHAIPAPVVAPLIRQPEGARRSAAPLSAALPGSSALAPSTAAAQAGASTPQNPAAGLASLAQSSPQFVPGLGHREDGMPSPLSTAR
eukprot:TRINITY_DN30066_c0_g1_i2.p1 TRINITY_DN30066_c0_g1~~TRINITY_DN30066_c0_g1_i2.p1  ORF type:complete len:751 (-),score=132.46 TRINITY_DN30066_c0_g1_i2:33-2285(-)